MEAILVRGEAKEIAALVLELQERQKPKFVPETSNGPCQGPMKERFTASH